METWYSNIIINLTPWFTYIILLKYTTEIESSVTDIGAQGLIYVYAVMLFSGSYAAW